MSQKADGTIVIDTKINVDGIEKGTQDMKSAFKNSAKSVNKIGKNVSSSLYGYDQSVIKYIENYVKGKQASPGNAEGDSEFFQNLEYAKKQLKDLKDSGFGPDDEEYDRQAQKVAALKAEYAEYSKAIAAAGVATVKRFESVEGKIAAAEAEIQRLSHLGFGIDDEEMQDQIRYLAEMKERYKELYKEASKTDAMREKEAEAAAAKAAKEAAAAEKINQKLEETRRKEAEAAAEAARLKEIGENAQISKGDIVKLSQELARLKVRQKDLEKAGVGLGYEEYDQNAAKIAELNKRLGKYQQSLTDTDVESRRLLTSNKKLGRVFVSLANGIGKVISNSTGFSKVFDRAKESSSGYNMSLLDIIRTTLLFGTISQSISEVSDGTIEGLQNLAQYSESTNNSISMMWSSLEKLKNTFATAFAPLLNVVAPILTSFINLISRAINYVAMFFAALTGQSTYTKALGVQKDYAASLEETASGAEDSAGAIEDQSDAIQDAEDTSENYTNSIDELNIANKNMENSTQSNTPSGGGSSGTNSPSIDDAPLFEEANIKNSIKNFADKIRDMIEKEDFDGLGELVASKLNAGMSKIKDAISWDNVGPTVTRFITGFTTFFNSLVNNFNWELLGQTIGTGINTIVNSLDLLVTGIDWINLGTKFAEGINGIVSSVDWGNVGQLIGNGLMILPNMLYGFVTEMDWSEFGQGIADAINGVLDTFDLAVLASGLSSLVIGLLESIKTILLETDWTVLGQQIADALLAIDWVTIAEQLVSIGGILLGSIFKAFGELPAPVQTVMAILAGFLVGSKLAGLVNFIISTLIPSIRGFIALMTGSGGIVSGIKSIATAIGTGGILSIAIMAAIAILVLLIANWDKVKAVMGKFDEFLKGVFATDWTEKFGSFGNVLNAFFKNVKNIWSAIKKIFNGITTFLDGVFSENWKKAWEGIKEILSGVWDGIVAVVKAPVNMIIGYINVLIERIADGLNSVIDAANDLLNNIPDSVPIIGGLQIPNIPTQYKIPYLASGAVIPPNKQFMAMLGDQKNGTNLEAPESLLRKIYREEALPQVSLMKEQNGLLKAILAKNTTVNLDGRRVSTGIDTAKTKMGYTFISR